MTVAPKPPHSTRRQGLRERTISGLGWSFGSTVVTTVIQLGHMVVMARLLTPADFGLVALATAFLRFGTYFAQMGVGPALVQRPTLSDREVRTAFTSSLLLGGLLSGVFVAAAPFANVVARDPDVVPVIQWLAFSMLINGMGTTASSLLRRDLHFRGLAGLEVGSYVVGYVGVGITLALLGHGVWSLVFASLAQAGLQAAAAYVLTRHRVRPLLAWDEIRGLYGYGAKFSGIQFIFVLRHALITAAVGRVAGVVTLGLFDRARLLVQLPFERVEAALTKVLFPAMSRVQNESRLLRRIYLLQLGLSTALFLPALAAMSVNADWLVAVLLGPQWSGAVPLVPWLAAAVGAMLLAHFARVLADAMGLMNQRLGVEVAQMLILVVGLALGSIRLGMLGLLIAIFIAELFGALAGAWIMRQRLDVGWSRHLDAMVPGLMATGLVTAVSIAGRALLLHSSASAGVALAVQISLGFVVLLSLFLRWGRLEPLRMDLAILVFGADGSKGSPAGWDER
ncbi:MAG: lipopolysaccharide biosynthesis protein [Gemmatimonadota bacterium]